MDFTNALANNEEDLLDEDFYYDEEDTVKECELFKHNAYKGNEILSTEEEISSLEKFNEKGITHDAIPSLRVTGKTLDIEMVVEAESTTVSTVMKGSSKSMYAQPVCSKIYKAELHYVKYISKCDNSISAGKFNKFIELIKLDLIV